MKGLKKIFLKFFKGTWPFFLIGLVVIAFFWKVFLLGLVPIPGDFVVGSYYPWLDYKWGYEAGVPVKNPITTDVISFTYPMQTLAIEMLKKGQAPLWNPYILAGTPLLANFQSAPFSPTNFLYFVFDAVSAWSFQIIFQHFLAALFTYFLIRHWGVSKIGSVVGGIIFAFSGFNLIWSQWNGHALAASFIPLILLFVDKWLSEAKAIYGFAISISLALMFLSGYPQVTLYLAVALTLLWLVRVRQIDKALTKTLVLGVYLLLGMGLASLQILPGAELLSLSQREVEPHPFEWAFLPWAKVITFVAADYFGNHATQNYWGPQDYTSNTGFVGIVALVFALIGLKLIKKRKEILFSVLLLVISLLLAFPTPVSIFLWKSGIFGLNAASAHRSLVLFNLAVSILSGFGVDALLNRSKLKFLWAFLLPMLLILVFGGYAVFFLKGTTLAGTQKSVVALRNLIIPTFAFLASLLLFWIAHKKEILPKKLVFVGIFLVMLLELFRFGWKFTPFSPRHLVFPKTPVLDFLTGSQKPFRVTGSRVIPINMKMPYKLEALEGYDAVYPLRVAEFLAALNGQISGTQPLGRYGMVDNDTSHLLDVANTKYYVTLKYGKDGPSALGRIHERFDPKRFSVAFEDKTTVVLESKSVLPRAYMVYNWEVEEDKRKTIDKLLNENFPFSQKVILGEVPPLSPSKPSKAAKVTYVDYQEQQSTLIVETEKDGMLFVSDTWYPGWKAYVDGREVKVYRANFLFRAISVFKGVHEVKFVYQPDSFTQGVRISAASLAILLIFLVIGNYRQKKLYLISSR